jgi:hypothetical protein
MGRSQTMSTIFCPLLSTYPPPVDICDGIPLMLLEKICTLLTFPLTPKSRSNELYVNLTVNTSQIRLHNIRAVGTLGGGAGGGESPSLILQTTTSPPLPPDFITFLRPLPCKYIIKYVLNKHRNI